MHRIHIPLTCIFYIDFYTYFCTCGKSNISKIPMYSASKPYNDLPELPPSSDIESRVILKMCINSNKLLAELKGVCASIPNASILINAIPLQEARSSSEIENIVTTNDELYRAITLNPDRIDAGTKEVLRYREALWSGVSVIKETGLMTTRLFEELCSIIKKTEMSIRTVPGTSIRNTSADRTLYTPPVGEDPRKGRHRSAHKDGGHPLSIRGHPSVYRWQRPNGTHRECLVSHATRIAPSANTLPKSIDHRT